MSIEELVEKAVSNSNKFFKHVSVFSERITYYMSNYKIVIIYNIGVLDIYCQNLISSIPIKIKYNNDDLDFLEKSIISCISNEIWNFFRKEN